MKTTSTDSRKTGRRAIADRPGLLAELGDQRSELVQKTIQLASLGECLDRLLSNLDGQALLKLIPKELCHRLGFRAAFLYLRRDQSLILESAFERKDRGKTRLKPPMGRYSLEQLEGRHPVEVRVWNTGRPSLSNRPFSRMVARLGRAEEPLGVVRMEHPWSERPLASHDLKLFTIFAEAAGMALENAQLLCSLEQNLRELETKSALVQEMHHRIKNNLQTVAGLLTLQQLQESAPSARETLGQVISRVKSIAVIHDLLSHELASETNLARVAERLSAEVIGPQLPPESKISISWEVPTISVPSRQATSFALIVNELVTNASQHAFPSGAAGEIIVRLNISDDQGILEVKDNGRGLPPDFDLDRDLGLGLKIVQALAKSDFGGRLTLRGKRGVVAQVEMKLSG